MHAIGLIVLVALVAALVAAQPALFPLEPNGDNILQLTRPLLIPRVPGTPGNKQARDYIVEQLSSAGSRWVVEFDSFTQATVLGERSFTNVIATLGPATERRLILSAHFDTLGTVEGFVGATDSAAPCAMLLLWAQRIDLYLAQKGLALAPHNTSLQLVFFDGEEALVSWTANDNTYGARHLAARWEQEGNISNIEALVLLDLLATSSVQISSLHRASRDNGMWTKILGYQSDFRQAGLLSRDADSVPSYYFQPPPYPQYENPIDDDHKPFYQRNVPILHLIAKPFPGEWHKISDNEDALSSSALTDLYNILSPLWLSWVWNVDIMPESLPVLAAAVKVQPSPSALPTPSHAVVRSPRPSKSAAPKSTVPQVGVVLVLALVLGAVVGYFLHGRTG